MNKLLGFYELKKSGLPTIPWVEYTAEAVLDEDKLWTIRTAVNKGNDLNLPRLVGAESSAAKAFADNLLRVFENTGMVLYYPYFIAEKSGTLMVNRSEIIIEAVKKDLWNLVTDGKRDVTYRLDYNDGIICYGERYFLTKEELNEFKKYAKMVKGMFRSELAEGKDILLEWSYAFNAVTLDSTQGDKYLVFYEARTI